jgi:hypothetical protein
MTKLLKLKYLTKLMEQQAAAAAANINMLAEAKLQISKPSKCTNSVWKYFSKYSSEPLKTSKKHLAICDLCLQKYVESATSVGDLLHRSEVNYGNNQSPSKLEQHIGSMHKNIRNEEVQSLAAQKAMTQTTLGRIFTTDISPNFLQGYSE